MADWGLKLLFRFPLVIKQEENVFDKPAISPNN